MRRKRTVWFIVGGALLLVVLVGAAFVGGRLLTRRTVADGGGSDYYRPAAELPQTPAEAQGIFVRRQDNSIFVGTGQVTIMKGEQNGTPSIASSHDGPTVEVVVNPNTTIYRDTTQLPDNPSGDVTVQQAVAPGSIEEIGERSALLVWGKKTGDRIAADVLVYSTPWILYAKPAN